MSNPKWPAETADIVLTDLYANEIVAKDLPPYSGGVKSETIALAVLPVLGKLALAKVQYRHHKGMGDDRFESEQFRYMCEVGFIMTGTARALDLLAPLSMCLRDLRPDSCGPNGFWAAEADNQASWENWIEDKSSLVADITCETVSEPTI